MLRSQDARDVIEYVPCPTPKGAIVALHGLGVSPARMRRTSCLDWVAGQTGCVIAYPRGGLVLSWNWWSDMFNSDLIGIVNLAESICGRFSLSKSQVFFVGHSAGGCMAALSAALRPWSVGGVVVYAGWLAEKIVPVKSGSGLGRPQPDVLMVRGAGDRLVSWKRMNRTRDILALAGSKVEATELSGGHGWNSEEAAPLIAQWINRRLFPRAFPEPQAAA